jgi:hypothetical protein
MPSPTDLTKKILSAQSGALCLRFLVKELLVPEVCCQRQNIWQQVCWKNSMRRKRPASNPSLNGLLHMFPSHTGQGESAWADGIGNGLKP